MSTSADDHSEKGLERVEIAGGSESIHDSQLDDDCVSENSFGSSFGDHAMNEENVTADIELESSPPVYSDEEYLQSDDIYGPSVDLDVVPQYTPPTRSSQPALNEKSSGPSMCVVRGLIFNPALTSINILGLQTFTRLQQRWSFLHNLRVYMCFQNVKGTTVDISKWNQLFRGTG